MPLKSPLRIGILGTANIARQFVRDVRDSRAVQVVAVASRSMDTARAFADTFAIAGRHASYEALLAAPDVDAVYIPLPNTLHAPWCIRAAEHGKHVLCEKPLAVSLKDARAIFSAARAHRVVVLESYPYWFQPQTRDMMACLTGPVRAMQASFGFTLSNPAGNIRLNPDLGGGALLDAGSYPLSLIRLVMGDAPVRVMADATMTNSGVDISTMATLFFSDGRRAQMSCTMDAGHHRRAVIIGKTFTIETEYLNHTSDVVPDPRGYLASELRVRKGIMGAMPFETVRSPAGSGFRFAAEAFADLIHARDNAAFERHAAMSEDIAAMLEAIALSARTGQPVDLDMLRAGL